jgi:hypothetical protein
MKLKIYGKKIWEHKFQISENFAVSTSFTIFKLTFQLAYGQMSFKNLAIIKIGHQ